MRGGVARRSLSLSESEERKGAWLSEASRGREVWRLCLVVEEGEDEEEEEAFRKLERDGRVWKLGEAVGGRGEECCLGRVVIGRW